MVNLKHMKKLKNANYRKLGRKLKIQYKKIRFKTHIKKFNLRKLHILGNIKYHYHINIKKNY